MEIEVSKLMDISLIYVVALLIVRNRITSYINNLHPQRHKDIYGIIEKIIAKVIPLWNMTLTPLQEGFTTPPRISNTTACEYDPDPDTIPEEEKPQREEGEM